MAQLSEALVVAQHINYTCPGADQPLLVDLSFTVLRGRRYGLVGTNGTGKSTLLKLIGGELRPLSGRLQGGEQASYLPQDPRQLTAAFGLIVAKFAALKRLAAGRGDEEATALVGDDWDLAERLTRALRRLGVATDILELPPETLSGGQQTSLRLAALFARRSDLLLLDEPTNHLDQSTRQSLLTVLDDERARGVVIASHDRVLLEQVDEIWELSANGLRRYGGAFGHYREQRRQEEAAAAAQLQSSQMALKRATAEAVQVRERQEHRLAAARSRAPDLGLPQIIVGMMERSGQETSAKQKRTHGKRIAEATQAVQDAKTRTPETQQVHVDLLATALPRGKTVLRLRGVNWQTPEMTAPLWVHNISVDLIGPQRVALAGRNGVGKSTLLRLLCGLGRDFLAVKAEVYVGVRWAYLDQAVSLLDERRTLVEQLRDLAPSLTESERRTRLGRFLFGADKAEQPITSFSGGERMRAGLACALLADRPPQLLLLDEPGNHLDLASLAALTDGLEAVNKIS